MANEKEDLQNEGGDAGAEGGNGGEGGDKGDQGQGQDTKKQLTPAQRFGILKREQTKLLKDHPELAEKQQETESRTSEKKKDFDYAEKAYLKASGIESSDFSLVKEAMESSGKSLDEVLESKWFQAELKERREQRASDEATPKGAKRSGQAARDSVDYWIAKGTLPPNTPENQKLRRDVVAAKKALETNRNKFSPEPVV